MTDFTEQVIWEDAALLVINKPAGLPVLPDGYNPEAPCLVALLKQAYDPLWVVHRLDKETSGIILFARTAAAHRQINTQFERRQVAKRYHALVAGRPPWEAYQVNLPLRSNADRRHRTLPDAERGKPASTDLRCLERFGACSLLEATPRTGRTHQIRAHLAALGYPLLGDRLYSRAHLGPETMPGLGLARLALHAWQLAFQHPLTQETVVFCAPYPVDFAGALDLLRSQAA